VEDHFDIVFKQVELRFNLADRVVLTTVKQSIKTGRIGLRRNYRKI